MIFVELFDVDIWSMFYIWMILHTLGWSWWQMMNDEGWLRNDEPWTVNDGWWRCWCWWRWRCWWWWWWWWWNDELLDWLIEWVFVCLFVCFVLFCLFVCPKPFWSLEVLWLRVCDLHIIIEKNHCICSMIWIELALPYSLQGLDRWKRQLVSVLRDGHALLTTLNEGATLSGSMVT